MSAQGVLSHYKQYLPLTEKTPMLSLGEGDTPLVRSVALSQETGCDIYFKLEGCNPTGSFKDRGMVVAMAKAAELGAKAVVCASTGNTSASAAAYAARAGLMCAVLIPSGQIARGKLAQAYVYGAKILAIDGNFDRALELTRELSEAFNFAIVNSINPDRLEGQKTAAFEIVDDLGRAPDILALPVGNAGNITAYWKGFKEYMTTTRTTSPHDMSRRRPAEQHPRLDVSPLPSQGEGAKFPLLTKEGQGEVALPRLWGFQAEGAAPLVSGTPVTDPHTVATAIKIGNPASWNGAIRARDESGGEISAVSDDEIREAHSYLAAREGLFVEPASASSVAGILKKFRAGTLERGQTIVCVLTGNGLKDVDFVLSSGFNVETLPADAKALASALQL
jgi:threonine synthase